MNYKKFIFLLSVFSFFLSSAQKNTKEVLFTIDQKPYYTDEFERVYKKNLDLVKDESQKDLNLYLDLFIGYKLKVNKAHKLGLQDGQGYQNELKTYRAQLAKNYFNDTKVTQALIDEGYNRLQKEIRASHILIMVDENAAPEDTLKAYNKIVDIRNRAIKGESFDALAEQLSEDPSAKDNKGDLGYFTAFRMVYPFETAAYNTKKGEISKICRTRFGYHILKVNDIRPNRGEVTVAHIMILNPKPEDEDQNRAVNTINDIYKKINQGEKFEDLAKQFSEDKSSASKGGMLNKFSSGQLSSEEFESVAFSLSTAGDISKPFQTQFGWHIVKLIEKHPVKTQEMMKVELENKISRDERSKKIEASLTDKLRKKYTIKRDAKQLAAVTKLVNDKYYEGNWEIPTNIDASKNILSIQSKNIVSKLFLEFLEKQQKNTIPVKPISKLVAGQFEKFIDEQLNVYYDENLENEFPEFSHVMEEYRDGLLLFELMEKEIWNRSKTDTLGLEKFYNANKEKYPWKRRVEASIFSSTKKETIEKALSMLKKGVTPNDIKDRLNTKDVINLMVNSNTFEEGSDALPKGIKFETGIGTIIKEGEYYFLVKVDKVLPAGYKTMDECRGKLTNDYQQYLEQHWVDELKQEFSVQVNQDVFTKVKQALRQ